MSSRAVQEPEAWFAFGGGSLYIDGDAIWGSADYYYGFQFRLHSHSSGYLLNNNSRGNFIGVSGGTLTFGGGDYTQKLTVSTDEWHMLYFLPSEKQIQIDGNIFPFGGQPFGAIPYFVYHLNYADVGAIIIGNSSIETKSAALVPNEDPLGYKDTTYGSFYSFSGTGDVEYQTPEPPIETGWITVNPTAGTGTTVVTLTAENYTGTSERRTSFRIEGVHGTVVYLTAYQEAFEPLINLNPASLSFSQTGGTQSITVTSDYEWVATAPAWLEISPSSGQTGTTEITVTAQENTGTTLYEGEINFRDSGETLLGVAAVTQMPQTFNAELDNDHLYSYDFSAATFDNGITSNVPWTAICLDNYVTIQPYDGSAEPSDTMTGGTGYTQFKVLIGENTGSDNRIGRILFYYSSTDNPLVELIVQQITDANIIHYTSLNGGVVKPSSSASWPEILSNTYEEGQGKIVFAEPLTEIPANGFNTFLAGDDLVSVSLPDTVVRIAASGFYGCDQLQKVDFGSGLKTIEINAFNGCPLSGDTGMLTLPDSLETIAESAFYNYNAAVNGGFTGLTMGPNVLEIGSAATITSTVFPSTLAYIKIAAETPPSISQYTFYGVATGGTLVYPNGSDYSSWLAEGRYYLGYYDWNGLEEEINHFYVEFIDEIGTIELQTNENSTIPYDVKYSYDGELWENWVWSQSGITPQAKKIYLKAYRLGDYYFKIKGGNFRIGGNIIELYEEDKSGDSCYTDGLFINNNGLTDASELIFPETHKYSCAGMFRSCTSLTKAPEVPKNLIKEELEGSIMLMFSGCASLNYVKMNTVEGVKQNTVENMLLGVSPTGTLVIPSAATYSDEDLRTWTGMPDGWTIQRQ